MMKNILAMSANKTTHVKIWKSTHLSKSRLYIDKHISRGKNLQIYSRILTITHDDIGAIAQVQFLYSHIIYYMAHSKGRSVVCYRTEGYARTTDPDNEKTHYMNKIN